MGVMVFSIENVKKSAKDTNPLIAFASVLLGGMFLYESVTTFTLLNTFDIKGLLLVVLGILSTITLVGYGIKNIYPFGFANGMLAIPVLYYVVKLIHLFVNTSALALITENIFLLFANSAILWFVFEFASLENEINISPKKKKTLLAIAIATILFADVAAMPKLILALLQKNEMAKGDISASLLMLAQAFFVFAYIHSNFAKSKDANQEAIGKHSV